VAFEHQTEGPRRRPKGIPRLALVETFLNPRFKFGPGFCDKVKEAVWEINCEMMMAAKEGIPEDHPENEDDIQQQQLLQQQQANNTDLFHELNQMAEDDLFFHGAHNNNIEQDDMRNNVDSELLLYKREPHLPLQKVDGSYNNP
jgi:hypothetical protein